MAAKKLIGFRVEPSTWRAVKRLAAVEQVPVERIAEHALLAYLATVQQLRKDT